LSGPAIKPIALLKVHQVYQVCKDKNIPIIGQGGITSVDDALEFFIAGATAIGIGTALFYEPFICKDMIVGLTAFLKENNVSHISELTGSLKLNG